MFGRLRKLPPTAWVTLQMAFEQLFWIALFAIQAPLLGPRAFGLFAIVMIFIGFCEFVLSSATSEALISLIDAEDLHFQSMTTASALIAVILGAVLFVGADELGRWFGDQELAPMLRWMSVLPLISAFSSAPVAVTRRAMEFRPTAVRSIASLIFGGSIGLFLTLKGAGVWALVWQALIQRLVGTIVMWRIVDVRFRLTLSRRHLLDLKRLALTIMLSRTMNWASAQLPRLILGLFLGPTELGLFGMAARLNDILFQVALEPKVTVARVDLRRHAADPDALQQAVSTLFLQLGVFCFPLCVGAAAVVPTLFKAWLDPHWYGGILPAQLLLLMGVPTVTFYCATAVLLATNHTGSEALISTVQTLSASIVTLIAAPFGLDTTALVMAIRPVLLLPLPTLLIRRDCGIPLSILLTQQLRPLIAATVMGLVVVGLGWTLGDRIGSVALLPILIVAGAVVYLAALWLLLPEMVRQLMAQFINKLRQRGNAEMPA